MSTRVANHAECRWWGTAYRELSRAGPDQPLQLEHDPRAVLHGNVSPWQEGFLCRRNSCLHLRAPQTPTQAVHAGGCTRAFKHVAFLVDRYHSSNSSSTSVFEPSWDPTWLSSSPPTVTDLKSCLVGGPHPLACFRKRPQRIETSLGGG